MLDYDHYHCSCAAAKAEKGYIARIKDLEKKLSKTASEREGDLESIIDAAEKSLNTLYSERALLVAFLSAIFKSSLEEPSDKEEGFRFCLYMQTPFGQVSWHVADGDLHLFNHVPRDQGQKWDGHDNNVKEQRIKSCIEWLKDRHATF